MKKTFFTIAASLLIAGCIQSTKSDSLSRSNIKQDKKPTALSDLFTLPDAEKILGEPAHLEDSSTKHEGDASRYQCAFKANGEDAKSGKTGVVYLLVEHYSSDSSAHKKYSFIKTANENHGIKTLDDLGDEAYFHTDNENFYFVMVRKGVMVFNMKVNKITSHTSLDEFNAVAKKITDGL